MKNTKKILSLFLTLFLITACSKQGVSQEKILYLSLTLLKASPLPIFMTENLMK